MDMSQIINQLQAQIQQLQVMLNNTSLPAQVRQQAQMKHQQLQMELQQAQAVAAMAAAQSFNMQGMAGNMGGGMGMGAAGGMGGGMGVGGGMGGGMPMQEFRQWTNSFPNQQPAGQDSAYQRLPLNNRRRPLKRDRPSDFLEIAGAQQGDSKTARYWE